MLHSIGFESDKILAAFDVLHSSIDPYECLSETKSLFPVFIRICPALGNVCSDCACDAGMASKGLENADSREKSVELSFYQ